MQRTHVVVVGSGPYGLSTAAHLLAAGIDTRVFGSVMQFWKDMPKGMLLRSEWDGSHIPDPARRFTLDAYADSIGRELPERIPMTEFARYGEWFQRNAVPQVDPRMVTAVAPSADGFTVTLEDGETIGASRVVIATGLTGFARRPGVFRDLPREGVTHTSEERDFADYDGRSVIMVGAGQSALECAALLNEGGAKVEVLTRGDKLNWLAQGPRHISRESGRMAHLLYPPGAVGPLGVNWVVQLPGLYRALPAPARKRVFDRALRPAGSGWVKPRTQGVVFTSGVSVASARMAGDRVELTLSNGERREVDHVLLGTGYQVDLKRYPFFAPELAAKIKQVNGQPDLRGGFESSVPGLHFLGAPADICFGPLMRFVAGAGYAARAVAATVAHDRRPSLAPIGSARPSELAGAATGD